MRSRRGITIFEMLLVVLLVSLLAGLTFPSVTSGLDSLRLRSAADGAAGLLTQAMARVEKTQAPVELMIDRVAGTLEVREPGGRFAKEQKLEPGVKIAAVLPPLPLGGEETVRVLLLEPGAPFPGVGIVLTSERGQRRLVRIDPVTAMAVVETPPESVSEKETR